ncbi:aldo/keto reductase [Campylobacter iguaniorum]|uniref:Aldo/keto reductase n=1 Tax=Campylobacter iguaniorum TaxID=1244531 RepID=A0A076FC42_9BACT|nr:aldo/keto reductase [Campylobacter iguaniorum]AII15243.1 aldo/keto reductase [Campylobacter iguaniorum]
MQSRREFMLNLTKFAGGLAIMNSNLFAANKEQIPNIVLNNGVKMPILGYGTYKITGDEATSCTLEALEVGYRLIDTAQMYHNESEIGVALKRAQIPRNELFITTKLSSNMSYKQSIESVNLSMKKLGLDQLDLLLLHWDFSDSLQMYKAMEEVHKKGIVRAIGISNFSAKKYMEFIQNVEILPAINQVEAHVFTQQKDLQKVSKNTILEAWSPFANGKNGFFKNEILSQIGKKYGKTVAQIGLRFLIQNNIIAIPKTTKKSRMIENINIFDFSLDSMDLAQISGLDMDKSLFGWYEYK